MGSVPAISVLILAIVVPALAGYIELNNVRPEGALPERQQGLCQPSGGTQDHTLLLRVTAVSIMQFIYYTERRKSFSEVFKFHPDPCQQDANAVNAFHVHFKTNSLLLVSEAAAVCRIPMQHICHLPSFHVVRSLTHCMSLIPRSLLQFSGGSPAPACPRHNSMAA
ncbi:hypothetical protein EYF80_023166 [Liparis tanakae]|uniref:Uncharacterized protein n=1 Tax=Liparis tanakae TaxID=230148 RepID=A0A4Z2HPC8_9TELE|nr:hypothetical protein EYF80_023166 [Liparis tanakae]